MDGAVLPRIGPPPTLRAPSTARSTTAAGWQGGDTVVNPERCGSTSTAGGGGGPIPAASSTGPDHAQVRCIRLIPGVPPECLPRPRRRHRSPDPNARRTARYSCHPLRPDFFLWKNIREQFWQGPNLFFLLMTILNLIPGLAPYHPLSTLIEFAACVLASGLKAAAEDFGRHRTDTATNSRPVDVFREGHWVTERCAGLRVGDVVRVNALDTVPADLLVLHSSNADQCVYVQTNSIDGDHNVKLKGCPSLTVARASEAMLDLLEMVVRFEDPTPSLSEFSGTVTVRSQCEPVGPDHLLLQGSRLLHTDHVFGLVLYVGAETKVMKNVHPDLTKRSTTSRELDQSLRWIFVILVIMALFCAAGNLAQALDGHAPGRWFLQGMPDPGVGCVAAFATFAILFQDLVPVCLLFLLEVARAVQGHLIHHDLGMYGAHHDRPAVAWSTDLNEELGQVQCAFLDKTGTLTRNELTFFKFAVEGVSYGQRTTEVGRLLALEHGWPVPAAEAAPRRVSGELFLDPRIDHGQWQLDLHSQAIQDLFHLMAVCHTAVPHVDPVTNLVRYQAQAREDVALLRAADHFGFRLHARTARALVLEVNGTQLTFEILRVLPWTAERLRVSVIVRTPEDGILVYCKGTEAALMPRLSREGDQIERTRTVEHIRAYAKEGLRTVVCAGRTLGEEEYDSWSARYIEATRKRSHEAEVCVEDLERDLDLIGAVAIEDSLQPDVPATIQTMIGAGMKLWMLTGDKQEAAINTATACGMLAMSTEVIRMDGRTLPGVLADFDHAARVTGGQATTKADTDGCLSPRSARKARMLTNSMDHALVIDAGCLACILRTPDLTEHLLALSSLCRTVLCCRLTPAQKADVVRAVRTLSPGAITLAVGDGADDGPMIQAAHVGVSVAGRDGMQAARAAEYSIAQFSFLTRLLFVHGRWDNLRITRMIYFCFYKNVLLVVTEFCFALCSGFSGLSPYDVWAVGLWTVLWTALPVLVVGILDQDVQPCTVLRYPALYATAPLGHKALLRWVALAAWHGLVVFTVVAAASYRSMLPGGRVVGLQGMGILLQTCVLVVGNLKIALETPHWTLPHAAVLLGSTLLWFVFWLVYETSPRLSWDYYQELADTGSGALCFLVVPLAAVLSLGGDFLYNCYRHHLRVPPDTVTAARYREKGISMLGATRQRSPRSARLCSIAPPVPRAHSERHGLVARIVSSARGSGQHVVNALSLCFGEREAEAEYRTHHLRQLRRHAVGLLLASAVCLGHALYATLALPIGAKAAFWFASFAVTLLAGLVVLWRKEALAPDLHPFSLLLLVVVLGFAAGGQMSAPFLAYDRHPLAFAILTWLVLAVGRPLFREAVQYVALALAVYLGVGLLLQPAASGASLFLQWYEVLIVDAVALGALYQAERVSRALFFTTRLLREEEHTLQNEREVAESLLLDMMPRQIVPLLNAQKVPLRAFSMPFQQVSILQSDIVGFTAFAATREPGYVVKVLNAMFIRFDALAHRLRVEKIKTIGDAYVAASGVPVPDLDHANKIALLGVLLIENTHDVNADTGEALEIRVGIATGPVHAGFLGRKKVAYELYGETLREAERMESTSRPMRVQCTPGMANVLRTSFEVEVDPSSNRCFVVQLVEDSEEFIQGLESDPDAPVPYHENIEELDAAYGDNEILHSTTASCSPEDLEQFCAPEWQVDARRMEMGLCGRFRGEDLEQRFVDHQCKASYKERARTYGLGLTSFALVLPLLLGIVWAPGRPTSVPLVVLYCALLLHTAALGHFTLREAVGRNFIEKVQEQQGPSTTAFHAHLTISGLASALAVALTVSAVATVGIGAAGQIGEVSCFVLMVLLLGAQLSYSHFFFRLRSSLTALHLIGVVVAIVVCLGPDQYAALWAHVAAWGLSLVPAYFQERHTRQVFLASLQLCSRKAELTGAKKKVEHTLYKVLPQSIVRRVYRNPDRAIVDFAEDASVLFVYFHLRTEGEGGGAEARPMAQLDALVALLDRMVDLTPGVEKIKTLPYLVVAGLPDENPRHAPALAALARNIFRHLGRLSVDVRRNLRLQVGIHSGPLCAGLLGKNKFIYDVFGDTVNVASRLAAASEDARVMVSEAFMRKCEDAEDFEERGVVELRNRGPVRCFYLCLHNKAEVTPISPSST